MNKNEIKLLVFDLDGTLIDSKKDICVAVNLTLTNLGEDAISEEVIADYVGTGIQPLLHKVFEPKGEKLLNQALEDFKVHYSQNLTTHTRLFPKMTDVLEHYQSIPKAILTNKSNAFMTPILEKLELEQYFRKSYGRTSFPTQKPDAGPLLAIAKEFQVEPKNIVMIGDTDVDMMAGKNAKTQTCAVLFGYGHNDQLAELKPDFIVRKPEDLIGLFSY